jgi:hypothetical protein
MKHHEVVIDFSRRDRGAFPAANSSKEAAGGAMIIAYGQAQFPASWLFVSRSLLFSSSALQSSALAFSPLNAASAA